MTALVVVTTFIIALMRGGRFRDLGRTEIKHVWVFPLGAGFLVLLIYASMRGWVDKRTAMQAQPLVYLIAIVGLVLNRHIRGAWTLAAGTFLNFLVIAANGGYMPVSEEALRWAGLSAREIAEVSYLRHIPISASTRLPFLSDTIPIIVPYSKALSSVGSVGDIFVLIGLVVMVWRLFFPGKVKPAITAS